jgi:hypothetical protein
MIKRRKMMEFSMVEENNAKEKENKEFMMGCVAM